MSHSDTSTLAPGWSDSVSQTLVFTVLKQLQGAQLVVTDPTQGTRIFGADDAPLKAQLVVKHPGFYRRLVQGGSVAAGEAYVEGWWDSPDLTAVIQVLARNLATLDRLEAKVGWLVRLKNRWQHWRRRNHRAQSRDNIAAHYDLGNELYRRFLDNNMLYSSALYDSEECTLEQAQLNKMDRLCRQLDLKPGDHLLEIGTGWGGLAIHAARQYGCKVTTTTISQAQHDWAAERIREAGLENRITLLLQDYRDLDGQYDKLVSVEMIEAVGKDYLDTYIRQCQALLKPNGLMALQAITIADQRFASYSQGVDFIQKHIFPGGFLPSITQLTQSLTLRSDFVVRDLKDMGLDYARTLSDWHHAFNDKLDELAHLGYDHKFERLWRYYFCYCEGGFLERTTSVVQLLLSRPGWRG